MAYCKKFFIILLILILFVFNFSYVFATDEVEEINFTKISGILATANSNVFTSNSSGAVRYFVAEPNYIYNIELLSNFSFARICVSSSELPAVNVPYNLLYNGFKNEGDTFTFRVNDESYISISADFDPLALKVTRVPVDDMHNAIGGLVENVGPNAFWGVFGSGIDFVFIIVIVAFGLFIIYKLIKGLSKGKSKI